MRKIKLSRIAIAAAVAALLLWTVAQTAGALRGGQSAGGGDAIRLLYQVSELHMELLGSTLQTAGGAKSAAELEPLKQALYTATFTHDRFVQAVGRRNLAPLHSLTELSQLMLRLQLGGARPVKPEEAKLLQAAAGVYAELEISYSKLLLSSGDGIVSSQSKALSEADDKLEKLLKQQGMQ